MVERSRVVEPTRLRPKRGGPDSAVVVAVLLVGFIAVALLKPWDRRASSAPVAGGSIGSPGATDEPSPASERTVEIPRLGIPRFGWTDLGPLQRPPDEWGVQAIVARPDRSPGDRPRTGTEIELGRWFLDQRWAAATPRSAGLLSYGADPTRIVSDAVILPTDGVAVAAIGVTTPLADAPLDLRVWRLHAASPAEWVATRDVPGPERGPQRLLVPIGPGGERRDHWGPGLYRLDVLMGDRITRLAVLLPGAEAPSAATIDAPPRQSRPRAALPDDVTLLPPGPFLVDADGVATHLASASFAPLDERSAWLASADPRGLIGSRLARVGSGRIAVIGFKAGSWRHARVLDGSLYRLAPDGGRRPIALLARADTAAVRAQEQPRPSDVWPLGVYRLDVSWRDDDGRHQGSWHFELIDPGAPLIRPPWLRAVTDWAGHRGRTGVVIGTARPDQGGPRSARIRGFPQRPSSIDPREAVRTPDCGGAALFEAGQRLVGIAHEHAHVTPELRVRRWFEGSRSVALPVAVTASAVPGLVIAGLAEGGPWSPGVYEATLRHPEPVYDPDPVERFVFCVGHATADGLRVPRIAVSTQAYVPFTGARGTVVVLAAPIQVEVP